MNSVELMLGALAFSFGLAGAFLFGCVAALRRRVAALEEYIESLENSFLR